MQPKRWQVRLGADPDGGAVTIPGSQVNLLIAGGSQSGKSHLAGLLAERLVAMGYVTCVIDPEGDHIGLQQLRGLVVVGGTEPPPSPEHLGRLLRLGSVVVDLSLRRAPERVSDCRRILEALAEQRERSGTPHWIILDEAHLVPDLAALLSLGPTRPAAGVCAITWRPDQLGADTLSAMDLAIVLPGDGTATAAAFRAAGFVFDPTGDRPTDPAVTGRVEGRLLDRRTVRAFVADQRTSLHLRHWHKYRTAELPYHRRFFFRRTDRPTGAVAASMADFHHEIARAEPDVLLHHARNRDFSRWTSDVIRDHELAAGLRKAEAALATDGDSAAEEGRRVLLRLIEAHYANG